MEWIMWQQEKNGLRKRRVEAIARFGQHKRQGSKEKKEKKENKEGGGEQRWWFAATSGKEEAR